MADQSSEPTAAQSSTADASSTQQNDDDLREHKPIDPKLSRKRTKTGCLTCRRRRIKCGEERPTCANCIRSKRQCEGYNQRVIFKNPLSTYRGPSVPRPRVISPPGASKGPSHTPYGKFTPLSQQAQPSLPTIAPNPEFSPCYSDPHDHASTQMLPSLTGHSEYSSHSDAVPFPGSLLDKQGIGPIRQQSILSSHHNSPPYSSIPGTLSPLAALEMQPMLEFPFGNNTYRSVINEPLSTPLVLQEKLELQSKGTLTVSVPTIVQWIASKSLIERVLVLFIRPILLGPNFSNIKSPQYYPSQQQLEDPTLSRMLAPQSCSPTSQQGQCAQNDPDYTTQQIWEEEAGLYDISDDDVYMTESEENLELEAGASNSRQVLVDVRNVVALQTVQQQRIRGFRSFANARDHENSLSTYQPTFQSTPLKDSKTALVFAHFVNITGPSLSMFERHPANPALMFSGSTIPINQRHIWTYTIPTMALTNQALLHACLAISSLHIAKLQGWPVIASLKHYHISLRRVARSVGLPTRRGHPAVVAATMLLGYYEVMAADHQKWTNHLLGAKQLLGEIDYVGMTRYQRSMRCQQRALDQANNMAMIDAYGQFSMPQQEDDVSDIDENLISNLAGRVVRYDNPETVDELSQYDLFKSNTEKKYYSPKEMETYEYQRDMWWWFCKQDVYQSILGGNRLFLDCERWSDCPPRAPMGRLDLPVGNFDHLVLVMARVAEFTAKDLKRKRKEMAANHGHWRPPPGFQMPGPPPHQSPQSNSRSAPSPMPNFPGMVPISGEARLPMGFSACDESSASTSEDDGTDLAAAKERAEEEWQSIRQAFAILESNFGPDYQPLGSEYSQPKNSPFGPALQYRSYQVVCTWLNYYMGFITLMRAHPSMPPAMAVATGIAAQQTAPYAHTIGRIFAGIMPEHATEVTPSVSSVLVESTVSVFCAAVQYQDNAQRKWTIRSLSNVTRLTGWQTAQVIATGLEHSWLKAAEMGKGSPYQKDEEGPERILDAALQGGRLHSVLHQKNINHDKSIVVADRTDRVHWALGLLAAQEDLDSLTLKDDDA